MGWEGRGQKQARVRVEVVRMASFSPGVCIQGYMQAIGTLCNHHSRSLIVNCHLELPATHAIARCTLHEL